MRWWTASSMGVGFALVLGGCSVPEGHSVDPGFNTGAGPGSTGGGTFVDPDGGADPHRCDVVIPIAVRDFSETHPDFERVDPGDEVRRGLVATELGDDRKPVYLDPRGCIWDSDTPRSCSGQWVPNDDVIEDQSSFDQWYRDVPDVNQTFQRELPLTETEPGSGSFVFESAEFFPLEPTEGWGITPSGNEAGANYLFTTEVHLAFTYEAGQEFTFTGDDDLWIFVNDSLALDLGGLHRPAAGTIDFDADAEYLGIVPGVEYRMDIFHAERHTTDSSFRIETNISCFVDLVVR
ncbi:MAG: fibro-slime domain-containing protein [Polyangiaceae bacterium]|nr:fibro-slime domain-containing protein [Polyangiaceae bacterium]